MPTEQYTVRCRHSAASRSSFLVRTDMQDNTVIIISRNMSNR